MKFDRTKNAARSSVFNVIGRVVQIVFPFILRTEIIYVLGIEYAGLNSLFTSILSVLNLAELGVGTALVYSMYEPLANDDIEKVNMLMRLYKIYYRMIGLVILVVGLAITPLIPYLVEGSIPDDINLYYLYFISLGSTVVTYWLFAYRNCILVATQRTDLKSTVAFSINIISYIVQFFVLLFTKNYYLYMLMTPIFAVIINIVTAMVAAKKFPQFKAEGKLPKAERQKINKSLKDLFVTKLGDVVLNTADNVIISAFLGLVSLAVFQNYYFVINALYGIFLTINQAMIPVVGNSILREKEEKNFRDLKGMTFVYAWIVTFCISCLASLFQPFMELWVGEEYLLDYPLVILFCAFFFMLTMKMPLEVYKDASGNWHKDRFRNLSTSLTNLALNIILVQFFDLYGILIATIASLLLLGIPWLLRNMFTTVFTKNAKQYILQLVIYLVSAAGIMTATALVNTLFINLDSLLLTLIARAAVCIVMPNVLMLAIFCRTKNFSFLLGFMTDLTKGKINFKKLFRVKQ